MLATFSGIACLPLTEGYTTSYRNFDVQTQKAKLLQLTVAGVESVTVPAGTFLRAGDFPFPQNYGIPFAAKDFPFPLSTA